MTFQRLDDGTYRRTTAATTMSLFRSSDGGWEMWTTNASTRAWGGGPSVRHFETLDDVEKAYASWRGVADFIASQEAPAWDADDPEGGQLRYSMASVVDRGLILEPKPSFSRRDVEDLILDSLFQPRRYGGQTLSPGEARFIVICSAIYHGSELSGPVRAATPQAIALVPSVATIH
jgi:hypothetical protein